MKPVNHPTTDGKPMPACPETVAEMIPVRLEEIARRKAPVCWKNKSHGRMTARDPRTQTYEQAYVGVWYECDKPGVGFGVRGGLCEGNAAWYSRELSAYHGMPYVVDETHWERWDGAQWQPVPREEIQAAEAAERAREHDRKAGQAQQRRRDRSASRRHARAGAAPQ